MPVLLEKTAIGCRATLPCRGHKTTCRRATTRGLEAIKLMPKLHEGCVIGHDVLVQDLDTLLTVDLQAKLHEMQRRCNVKSAQDSRDHHSSRDRCL